MLPAKENDLQSRINPKRQFILVGEKGVKCTLDCGAYQAAVAKVPGVSSIFGEELPVCNESSAPHVGEKNVWHAESNRQPARVCMILAARQLLDLRGMK